MSINGNGDTLTIKGARLKVSGGVQVSGSIAYTEDATGFGGVAAVIDNDNTLNITAGKTSGVAKIERSASASITAVDHTNVSNNTTIHIALKNTSTVKGNFVTIGTFADDGTVKVNYTDEYVIGPGETGMITVRKVAGILSMYIREMFTSSTTDTTSKPFYIKDGTNYKYPLYTTSGGNLVDVTINGVQYYRPGTGLKTKTRPPLGIPELIVSPSGNLAIGNDGTGTTVNYDVWGVPSSFKTGSIYKGNTTKAAILIENGESSGSFTESGASSGDTYSLYVNGTDVSSSGTVSFSGFAGTIAFHHDTFANSGDPYGDGTLAGATANAHVFADTQTGTYTWGTLSGNAVTSTNTTYTWTPPNEIEGADVLMVAGGGGGGTSSGGGGGAGELVYLSNQTISGQKTVVVGNGGAPANNGNDTSFNSVSLNGGGAGATYNSNSGGSGGSGGGASRDLSRSHGSSVKTGNGYGNRGGYGSSGGYKGGGGGGGAGEFGAAGGNWNTTYGSTGEFAGNGGDGLDYSSVFGTTYGELGWFAGGGGGGGGNVAADYSIGGRGGGGNSSRGTETIDAIKHTGSGGGADNGNGGSGIVLIKSAGSGKTIPKVTGATFDSTNVTFTVQQDSSSSIANIKYTINGGSEQTTPVGTLAVAHGLSVSASITVVAYAVDANGVQISTKKTVTGTITQPTLVNTISLTGGDWSTQNPVGQYDYISTNTNSTYYEYELSIASSNANYYIAYNWTTRKWFDTNTGTSDNTFGTSATDLSNTSRETTENPSVVYIFGATQLEAQFNNPYYQS